jgi:sigma-54 dependent transcriptional regulator, flagellar regulatory protein
VRRIDDFQASGAKRWPGNVRELSNLLERLAILYPDQIVEPVQLPSQYQVPGMAPVSGSSSRSGGAADDEYPSIAGVDLRAHLSRAENRLICHALDEAGGVVVVAARPLRLQRTTLVEKLRRMDAEKSAASPSEESSAANVDSPVRASLLLDRWDSVGI